MIVDPIVTLLAMVGQITQDSQLPQLIYIMAHAQFELPNKDKHSLCATNYKYA